MLIQKSFLVGFLVAIVGCAGNTSPPKEQTNQAGSDAAETLVRTVIAELLKVNASAIPMDKSISDAPVKADDLDLVEIVMELEDRHGVEISDAAIERYLGGKFGVAPPRITPNQLAAIVREAPKLQQSRRKK